MVLSNIANQKYDLHAVLEDLLFLGDGRLSQPSIHKRSGPPVVFAELASEYHLGEYSRPAPVHILAHRAYEIMTQ